MTRRDKKRENNVNDWTSRNKTKETSKSTRVIRNLWVRDLNL